MESENVNFSASTVHLEHITTALSCLLPFGTKEDVLIYIDTDGISFIRDCNSVIRIQLFLSKELFMSYNYENESNRHTKLCVKISHILDSVSVANRNIDDIVECTLSYAGYGSPFILIFEDSMISEKAEYSTYLINGMDTSGLELDRDRVKFECMIKGDVLYAALKDLKEVGCKECYIYAQLNKKRGNIFALISKSQLGLSKIILPNSKSILEKIEVYEDDFASLCYDKPVIAFFDFNLFDKMRMSTKIASKVLFRLDANGVLSVNILSHTDDIIISDTDRRKTSNVNDQLQLPKDYPGIVIEICLMEKERTDESSQRDVQIFMETNELGEQIKPYEKSPVRSTTSLGFVKTSNILGLTDTEEVLRSEQKTNSDEESGEEMPSFAASALPRFF